MGSSFLRYTAFILVLAGPLDATAASAYIGILKPETCGNSNGELSAYLSGTPIYQPLSYLWSNGATTEVVSGLAAGIYSVTITDGQGTQFMANTVLSNVNGLPDDVQGPSYTGVYGTLGFTGAACAGMCNGALSMPMVDLGGTAPFTIDFSVASSYIGTNGYGHPMYTGFCAQAMVDYVITDFFGCQGSGSFQVYEVEEWARPTVGATQGACSGSDIGSFTLVQNYGICDISIAYNGTIIVPQTLQLEFTTYTYDGLAAGTYVVDQYPLQGQCLYTQTVEVPDLGPGCTQVTGTSWYDQDGDCARDAGDIPVPGSVMLIEPGSHYAITDYDGSFSFNLAVGNYALGQTSPTLEAYCPATMPVPFAVNGPAVNIELANNSTAPLDVRVHASATNARPGFTHRVSANVTNSSIQATGLVTVVGTIEHPQVSYVSATPTPIEVSGSTITWQVNDLDYFGGQGFTVETMVPVKRL